MRELPERINFDDVWSLYEGRRPADVKPPEIETLNVDRQNVQEKMNAIGQKSLKPDECRGNIVCRETPLAFFISQDIRITDFDLKKVQVRNIDDPSSAKANGALVSGLRLVDKGDMFDMVDRWTSKKFRSQGFGNMVLQAAESFMQERATERQKTVTSHVNVAQLNVICWLHNNGYRPKTDEDAQRLSEVLAGDSGIVIGDVNQERDYIFKNIPSRDRGDFHNAYRISLVKEIHPKVSPSITGVQEVTQNLIDSV